MPSVSGARVEVREERFVLSDQALEELSRPLAWTRLSPGEGMGWGQGVPTDWAYYFGEIWFYPTPNATYTLTLWADGTLPALVGGTDNNTWTTAGEELIRSRTVADIKISRLREGGAIQEAALMAAKTGGFLSRREEIAYNRLKSLSNNRMMSGTVQRYAW